MCVMFVVTSPCSQVVVSDSKSTFQVHQLSTDWQVDVTVTMHGQPER